MLKHYLIAAIRGFRRNKLPAAVNLLSLSMGLMGFVAAYAVSKDLLSVGGRYPTAERIYVVTQTIVDDALSWEGVPITGASVKRYLEADLPGLEAVARATSTPVEHAVAAAGTKGYRSLVFADPEYLEVFPEPIEGAGILNPLAEPLTAVISEEAALGIFAETRPIGRRFRLDDAVEVTVAGVFAGQPTDQMGTRLDMLVSMDTRLALERSLSGSDSEQAGQGDSWMPVNLVTYVLLPADRSITPLDLERHLGDSQSAMSIPGSSATQRSASASFRSPA